MSETSITHPPVIKTTFLLVLCHTCWYDGSMRRDGRGFDHRTSGSHTFDGG